MIEEQFIRALHVAALREPELGAADDPHELFQTSTIGALLSGAYDGDLTFAELAEQGDLGLGTLNGLDGEMIAVDGHFWRADVDGIIGEIPAGARTPFAVVVSFSPEASLRIDQQLTHDAMVAAIEAKLPPGADAAAIRIDGSFSQIRARSVPRQYPPYRELAEVVADQHRFEFNRIEGTIVGFRFPDFSGQIEVPGYHLHFISADRRRGGHVLAAEPRSVVVQIDPVSTMQIELPPGVELSPSHTDSGRSLGDAIRRVERG